jgi:hypothetical protein
MDLRQLFALSNQRDRFFETWRNFPLLLAVLMPKQI